MKAASTVAMALATGIGLSALFMGADSAHAQAGPQCAPAEGLAEKMSSIGSSKVAAGSVDDGESFEVYSDDEGKFTAVITADGQSCLVNMGTHLTATSPEKKFPAFNQEISSAKRRILGALLEQNRTCGEPDEKIAVLKKYSQEEPVMAGVGLDGSIVLVLDTPDGAVKEDGTPSGDSWSALKIVQPSIPGLKGVFIACSLEMGEGWKTMEPAPDAGPRAEREPLEIPAPHNFPGRTF